MSAPLDAIKIDAEGPRPVPMGDVNIESAVTNPLTLSDEPISSIDLHVEILEDFDYDASDSEDDESDDSEDGSNDELKIFIVRIIRMTKYNLSETRAENQQSEGGASFLILMVPRSDADTLDVDSVEPIDTETALAMGLGSLL